MDSCSLGVVNSNHEICLWKFEPRRGQGDEQVNTAIHFQPMNGILFPNDIFDNMPSIQKSGLWVHPASSLS